MTGAKKKTTNHHHHNHPHPPPQNGRLIIFIIVAPAPCERSCAKSMLTRHGAFWLAGAETCCASFLPEAVCILGCRCWRLLLQLTASLTHSLTTALSAGRPAGYCVVCSVLASSAQLSAITAYICAGAHMLAACHTITRCPSCGREMTRSRASLHDIRLSSCATYERWMDFGGIVIE